MIETLPLFDANGLGWNAHQVEAVPHPQKTVIERKRVIIPIEIPMYAWRCTTCGAAANPERNLWSHASSAIRDGARHVDD